ncbi:hypothetical protein A1122_01245 [Yersinia pestis A1122]|nr:hypothetical protein YPC_0791 [Yersinia pestis biovar Medievalis str. Harbin 35]AEL70932.1 hypothetical protein A1122_01245 [Yersinia pestis A1122]EEO75700.1 hypothetical protein YP516_3633 [Yersinia pestis Nepal516]EEO82114.1 hypothetical protein YPF_1134 [Yersinia pestis biovar Orientalis str. India 195]EEO87071.1 hypothetical protein YPH_3004 [Yersinia pestis biovar Orientalis str. PEXU2]EEO91635.1 hypothetical protein YPS_0579 [Yersinia pestis Pestoides A]EKS47751.1 hypothetical protei
MGLIYGAMTKGALIGDQVWQKGGLPATDLIFPIG